MQHRERYGDSGVQNDKAGYRNGTVSSFQMSLDSACCILMAVYVYGGSDEIICRQLALDIGIGRAVHLM